MDWFVHVLKQYATFEGRARRAEFWWYWLVCSLVSVALFFLDHGLGLWSPRIGVGLFCTLFALYTLAPTIAVTVRRLHDTGRCGWWFWIWVVPLIGPLVLTVILARKGQTGDNAYGSDPKTPGAIVGSGSGA